MVKILLVVKNDASDGIDLTDQMRRALIALGCDVRIFNFRHLLFHKTGFTNTILNRLLVRSALAYKPDLVLVNKGESLLPGVIQRLRDAGMTTANWVLDEPFGQYFGMANRVQNIPEFDFFFCFDRAYLESIHQAGCRSVHYLPCSASPDVFYEVIPHDQRKYSYPVSFLGSYQEERVQLLSDIVQRGCPLTVWGYNWRRHPLAPALSARVINEVPRGRRANILYNSSAITLNVTHPQSRTAPNLRVFEVPLTRTFLLTENLPEMHNLFKVGREIITYKDEEELLSLIKYYGDCPQERYAIACAGDARIKQEHTTFHRVREILRTTGVAKLL